MQIGRDFFDVMENRRSIRHYRADPVPQGILDRLLRAAAAAPSAHNRQPWRYVLLADDATREELATAMGRRLAADRQRDGDDPETIRRDVERSYRRITGAPLVILVCLTVEEMDKYDDARRSLIVRNSWGPRWGMGGYCLLPYAFVLSDKHYTWDFWTIVEVALTRAND